MFIEECKGKKIKKKDRISIKVNEGYFPVDNIKFPVNKKKKIGAEVNKIEKELIRNAYGVHTDKKLWTGSFLMPVEGRITSVFGAMRKSGGNILWRHKGVDIAKKPGVEILAPADGKVILVGENFNLHGKTVVLNHGLGVISIYNHLEDIIVSYNDFVNKGQVIGHMGNTGLSTAHHLHWGLYVNSIPVNPLNWVKPESYKRK